ncbi:NAD-dependent epimerase/dehydratase family protein [Saccharopolyspora rectivirgula]|uniref:NAD-dependent epimerase/dehydratase family protein n=1 Tax=Saccharopolyspora rectivirgula TaxID=28042 RepID=UPI00191C09A6|nr:NAD(P)-dependent oxidoreductase [Saccharopolyspora rectivirgula]
MTSSRCEVEVPLRVVVAGATGVVGRTLLPMLRKQGHHVTALVRPTGRLPDPADVDDIVVADVLREEELRQVLRAARPDVVVDQTSCFREVDLETGLRRTGQLREVGGRNLVAAAVAAGANRIIGHSMAAYSPRGHDVLDEDAPLWTEAPGCWGEAVRGAAAAEEAVLNCSEIEAVVLRYGTLYGPGTEYAPGGAVHERVRSSALPLVIDGAGLTSFTHVEDAAGAVVAVLDATPGVYNVVDNEPAEVAEWLPTYARMVGGPEPVALTQEQARAQLDWLTVYQLTEQRGASNFRLREELGWRPVWPSWREGFAEMFGLWLG